MLGASCGRLPPSHREALQAFQDGRRLWRAAIGAAALFLGSPHMAHRRSVQRASAAHHAPTSADGGGAASGGGGADGGGADGGGADGGGADGGGGGGSMESADEELRRAFAVYDRDGNGSSKGQRADQRARASGGKEPAARMIVPACSWFVWQSTWRSFAR